MNLSAKSVIGLMVAVPIVITLATAESFQGAIGVGGAAAGSDGKKIYNARCSICHGVDGSGNTSSGKKLKATDLRTTEVQKQSDDLLVETVLYGVGKMPGFEKKLSQDKVQLVLTYIRELGQKD